MLHKFFCPLLVSAALLLSLSASAEVLTHETLNVSVVQPDGWNRVSAGEQIAFNFRHDETQSQIEVIGTRLITPDVASIFFETFHTALRGADFQDPVEEERTIGGHTGTETLYTFQHSGVDLRVSVFHFVLGDAAWIVVGYIEAEEYEALSPVLRELVASLRPAQGE